MNLTVPRGHFPGISQHLCRSAIVCLDIRFAMSWKGCNFNSFVQPNAGILFHFPETSN